LRNHTFILADETENIEKWLDPSKFKTMASGGKMSCPVKGGDPIEIDWNIPCWFIGNMKMNYRAHGNEFERRQLLFHFIKELDIEFKDLELQNKIMAQELPALLITSARLYKALRESPDSGKDMWTLGKIVR
jgi:phage/plasmid-associated DNA primase